MIKHAEASPTLSAQAPQTAVPLARAGQRDMREGYATVYYLLR